MHWRCQHHQRQCPTLHRRQRSLQLPHRMSPARGTQAQVHRPAQAAVLQAGRPVHSPLAVPVPPPRAARARQAVVAALSTAAAGQTRWRHWLPTSQVNAMLPPWKPLPPPCWRRDNCVPAFVCACAAAATEECTHSYNAGSARSSGGVDARVRR